MAVLGTLHADQIALSYRIGGTLRQGGDFGIFTDANVAAADTNAGLQAAALAVVVHADVVPAEGRAVRAVQMGGYSSELTDALILGLTTVVGLVGLTYGGLTNSRDLIPA